MENAIYNAKLEKIKALKETMMVEDEKLFNHCNNMLLALVGPNLVERWWESPNKAFDNQPPKEKWQDDPKSVWSYLCFHCNR